jgi:hypothetical protein
MPELVSDDELSLVDEDWYQPRSASPVSLPADSDEIPAASIIVGRSKKKVPMPLYEDFSQSYNYSSAEHILEKRYKSCSVEYDNNNYPNTAKYANSNPPPPDSADLQPEIEKWIDFEINQGFGIACSWRLVRFPTRKGTQEYASEFGITSSHWRFDTTATH